MVDSISEIKSKVCQAVAEYNRNASEDAQIVRVDLFGSFASGTADDASDVDLLVTFSFPVVSLFALGAAYESMEASLGCDVDIVQSPVPEGSLLEIKETMVLYEAA